MCTRRRKGLPMQFSHVRLVAYYKILHMLLSLTHLTLIRLISLSQHCEVQIPPTELPGNSLIGFPSWTERSIPWLRWLGRRSVMGRTKAPKMESFWQWKWSKYIKIVSAWTYLNLIRWTIGKKRPGAFASALSPFFTSEVTCGASAV